MHAGRKHLIHLPPALLKEVSACLAGPLIGASGLDEVPRTKGAYALLIRLGKAVRLERPRHAKGTIAPGWYVYAGSAHGPGGIHARVARHFRADKRVHWHVDRLTAHKAATIWASPAPGGHECDLVARFSASGAFVPACTGFGSSDCRRCETHLLGWKGNKP